MSNEIDLTRQLQTQLVQLEPSRPRNLGMLSSQEAMPLAQNQPLQPSSSAQLVAQMHGAFLSYLHGPGATPRHYAILAGDPSMLEGSQEARREEVEPHGFLWSQWGQKLMGLLSPFFSSVELRKQTMAVAQELEGIERRALIKMQEAQLEHYQDQFDTWRRIEISRQTLLMIQGVVVQIANDIIASVRRLPLSEENQEEMAKILFEKFAIPKLLQDLGVAEEGAAPDV